MRTDSLDKAEILSESRRKIARYLTGESYGVRTGLALTARILFMDGHGSGLAGQITARGPEPDTYWTQRLGLGLDEIDHDNLLLVTHDLDVLEGSGMPNPANRFHSWIYRSRPEVACVIHTHPIHASALAMLGRPLKVAHMDSCMLYDDVAFLPRWPGVPVGNEEGEIISGILQGKRAALLAHHGLVVASRSIEEACVMAVQIERTARLQLLAEAAGEIQEIDADKAREAHDWILQEGRSRAGFHYLVRRVLRMLAPEDAAALFSAADRPSQYGGR